MTGAAEIATALRGRKSGRGWAASCPAHGDRNPSLSISEGENGKPLVHCHAGCSQAAVIEVLRARGLWPDHGTRTAVRLNPHTGARRRAARERHACQRIDVAQRLWASGSPLSDDDPAGRYLASRGLPRPWPATLRFVVRAQHPRGATVPALVVAACRWPDRVPVAVQMTALTPDGRKAPVEPVRWTRGVLRGAAVQLARWAEGRPLVLVEGIEDGLTVLRALPGATPWAVLGAGNAAVVALPKSVEIILAFDGDEAGRQASDATSPILWARGHQVSIVTLPAGNDLNDLLRADSLATLAGRAS